MNKFSIGSRCQEPSSEQLAVIAEEYKNGSLITVMAQVVYLRGKLPKSKMLLNFLGSCHIKLGNSEAAIESYKLILVNSPDDFNVHFTLASLYMDIGSLEEALLSFERVVALNPSDSEAHNNLGTCWQMKNEFDKAIACYDRALGLDPNFVTAQNNLKIAVQAKADKDDGMINKAN